jgi:hypothetical protein
MEAPGVKARVTVHFDTPAARATSEAVAFRVIFDPASIPFLPVSIPRQRNINFKNAVNEILA